MIWKAHGDKSLPTIVLLHGGGLSDWSWQAVAQQMESDFHVITPILDGHGEDSETPFLSIQHAAQKVLAYIDSHCGGKVFALGGLSVGAQIALEALVQRPDVARFALLESPRIYPGKIITAMTKPICHLCYGMMTSRRFAKMQAKAFFIPEELFEAYYRDTARMEKQSLINMLESNGSYKPSKALAKIKAKTLIIVGEKEPAVMKKSAQKLHETIPRSQLYTAPKLKRGQFSLACATQCTALVNEFFKEQSAR